MVGRYDLPYLQVHPPRFSQFFQNFPAFLDFVNFPKFGSRARLSGTPHGQKSCFFLQCRVLWLAIQQKQNSYWKKFPAYVKIWKRRCIGSSLCELEKFSSCDNVPAFPGCCVVQLFASFSQLLYVAATSSSCYGGELMGRPNLGERPHVRAGKIWNYFQNLGRWANGKKWQVNWLEETYIPIGRELTIKPNFWKLKNLKKII